MMVTLSADSRAKETSIEATIIRADGRVEELGMLSYWHRNPLWRWWWKLKRLIRGR